MNNYDVYIKSFDWGAQTKQLKLYLNHKINIKEDKLTIFEKRMILDKNNNDIEKKFKKKIESITESNNNLIIQLEVHPQNGHILTVDKNTSFHMYSDIYEFEIYLNDEKLNLKQNNVITDADIFKLENFTASDGIKYNYAYFKPKTKSKNLIVWLHGFGEGGTFKTDAKLMSFTNKLPTLTQDLFQEYINYAHILAPQSPSFWMDTKEEKVFSNILKRADRNSYYTQSLSELIDQYKIDNGIEKVIIAGASNGGYMSLVLALNNPNAYDGIIPICEALKNEQISDEDLCSIKDLPMFYIFAENDDIVDPKLFEIPKIKRLRKLNAKSLYVYHPKDILDLTHTFKDENNKPFKYHPHASWIPFFNNDAIDEKTDLTVFDFIKNIFSK